MKILMTIPSLACCGAARQMTLLAKSLPSDRCEIPRRCRHIAQGLANLVYPHPQHRIGDMRPGPHVLPQFGLGYQAPGMLCQVAQDR